MPPFTIPVIIKLVVIFWLIYPLVGKILGEFWWRAWRPEHRNTWRAKLAFPFSFNHPDYGTHEYCEFPAQVEGYYRDDEGSKKEYLLWTAFVWPFKFAYWLGALFLSVTYHIVIAPWNFQLSSIKLTSWFKPEEDEKVADGPQDKLNRLQAEKVRIDSELKLELELLGLDPNGKQGSSAFRKGV